MTIPPDVSRLFIALLGTCLSGEVLADTLILRDGGKIAGQFSGGSQTTVRMIVEGRIRYFPLNEIASLEFDTERPHAQEFAARPPWAMHTPQSSRTIIIPPGTEFSVALDKALSIANSFGGDSLGATLETDLRIGQHLLAAKGDEVKLRIVRVDKIGRLQEPPGLSLELTQIRIGERWVQVRTALKTVSVRGSRQVAAAGQVLRFPLRLGISVPLP